MVVSLKWTTWVKLLACNTSRKSLNSFKDWIRWLITRYIFSSWTIRKMLFGSNLTYQFSAIRSHHHLMNRCHQWSYSGLNNKKLPQTQLPDVRKPLEPKMHLPSFLARCPGRKAGLRTACWKHCLSGAVPQRTWGHFWLQCLATLSRCRICH